MFEEPVYNPDASGNMFSMFSETFSETFINQYPLDINVPYKSILVTFFITYLWSLVLSAMPVLFNIGPFDYYVKHNDWYTGGDVVRFIEPIGGLLLNFSVFYKSGIFKKDLSRRTYFALLLFMLGAGIYGQGSSFHSASAMFYSALESIHSQRDGVTDLKYYMQTVWQHITSHYLYAAGYALMNAAQAFAYKDHKASQLGLTGTAKILLIFASILFAVFITAVAIDYPSGTIVVLVYLLLYGFGCIGGYLVFMWRIEHDKTAVQFGGRPILHHYFLAYCIATVLIVIWIIYAGGFKSRSEVNN